MAKLSSMDQQKQFWKWFEENAGALASVRSGSDPILEKVNRELQQVHPGLDFEMGLGEDGEWEFVVSANGIKKVFPVVEQLIASAPALPHWKFIAFRQPKESVSEILYGDFLLKTEDVWFSYGRQMGTVDITLYIKNLSPGNEELAIGAIFILLDNALGEYVVATRIGSIEHKPLPNDPAALGYLPLEEIKTIVA